MRITEPDETVNVHLTKREYFAALAMQGLLLNSKKGAEIDILATDAVKSADKLIEALNK